MWSAAKQNYYTVLKTLVYLVDLVYLESVWSVSIIWLNQINQIDQTDQMNKTGWRTFSAFCARANTPVAQEQPRDTGSD